MTTATDIKNRIAQVMHRTDLGTQLDNFLNDALERINRDFGVSLVLPPTGQPLPASDLLFLYAGLQAGYEYTNDGDNAIYAAKRYQEEVSWEGMTNTGKPTDQFAGEPPVIVGV